tara:strand:+ start:26195 stop:26362 length:168 start_codon:yes stop_codon:yes gene_type:complete
VEITIDNIEFLRNLGGSSYSIKFKTAELPMRVNESWIALMAFKYVREEVEDDGLL